MGAAEELDSIEIDGTMSDGAVDSDEFTGLGRRKFDLDVRPDRQVSHGKEVHAAWAHLNTHAIDGTEGGEYPDGCV